LIVREARYVIQPTEQACDLIERSAAGSAFPFTLGTTQCGMRAKVAVTATPVWAPTVTLHVPIPVQAPDQPVKIDPSPGVAVNVTEVPVGYSDTQLDPQSIPAGTLATVPQPAPWFETESVFGRSESSVKVAVTVVGMQAAPPQAAITLHVPVSGHPADQPEKVDPAAGVAVRATGVCHGYPAAQRGPQSIPAGTLDTVPDPVPSLRTRTPAHMHHLGH
jgi:hypothetical protein